MPSWAYSLTTGGTTTTTASTFDAANRLLSVAQNGGSASAVTSDADGNTLTDTSGRTMTWDSQNRMASCTKGGTASTYTYGADGLRRSSTANGVTTYYVYDGQTMIREMKRNAQTGALFNTSTYFQGPRGTEYRRDDTPAGQEYDAPFNRTSLELKHYQAKRAPLDADYPFNRIIEPAWNCCVGGRFAPLTSPKQASVDNGIRGGGSISLA